MTNQEPENTDFKNQKLENKPSSYSFGQPINDGNQQSRSLSDKIIGSLPRPKYGVLLIIGGIIIIVWTLLGSNFDDFSWSISFLTKSKSVSLFIGTGSLLRGLSPFASKNNRVITLILVYSGLFCFLASGLLGVMDILNKYF